MKRSVVFSYISYRKSKKIGNEGCVEYLRRLVNDLAQAAMGHAFICGQLSWLSSAMGQWHSNSRSLADGRLTSRNKHRIAHHTFSDLSPVPDSQLSGRSSADVNTATAKTKASWTLLSRDEDISPPIHRSSPLPAEQRESIRL